VHRCATGIGQECDALADGVGGAEHIRLELVGQREISVFFQVGLAWPDGWANDHSL
jgi:hypothetical protein